MSDPKIPLEVLFAEGHLTDVGIATLADGEEALVPEEVIAHAHSCAQCTEALRAEALHSVALGELVRAAVPAEAAVAPAEVALPWIPLAVGAVLAVVGMTLASIAAPLSFGETLRSARVLFGTFARAARAALAAEFPPAVTFASAALLVAVALVMMRASPFVRRVS